MGNTVKLRKQNMRAKEFKDMLNLIAKKSMQYKQELREGKISVKKLRKDYIRELSVDIDRVRG
jgi:hypothetical protein